MDNEINFLQNVCKKIDKYKKELLKDNKNFSNTVTYLPPTTSLWALKDVEDDIKNRIQHLQNIR